jgi:hypothetical protein
MRGLPISPVTKGAGRGGGFVGLRVRAMAQSGALVLRSSKRGAYLELCMSLLMYFRLKLNESLTYGVRNDLPGRAQNGVGPPPP